MTRSELSAMTVLQLRKLARENKITLSAGIDKEGIIARILENDIAVPAESVGDPAVGTSAVGAPASEEKESPKYQAAWHSSDASSFGIHPAQGGAPVPVFRPAWLNTSPSGRPLPQEHRAPASRPGSPARRFGPAAAAPAPAPVEAPVTAAPSAVPAAEAPSAEVPVVPVRRPVSSPLPGHRVGGFGPKAAIGTPVATADPTDQPFAAFNPENATPSLEELLASGDYEEGGGILELHPDGYGFLRAPQFLPSTRDIYVSMAQIRRFGLRTGDEIRGKIRPQREGDKYSALLYIDTINGMPEAESDSRPSFDELTPVYPTRRISLEYTGKPSLPDMRLIDLIAPLGFGQRALILCPPGTGKLEIMKHYAEAITENYPDVHVLMLLIDMNPEDVTMTRDALPCPVLATTFDQAPEVHLRLTEMVMERAMRLVEQKKDVVILADSLTRLAKIYTTSAVQQGRSVQGMVNPSSLFRAKKLFGAARNCKEGGSLTVIAAMDVGTGSRVDESIVEEFKGAANMELTLDAAVAAAGISPAVNLQKSSTKNADQLLNPRQKEGLGLIRQMLGTTSSAVAIPQLLAMMDKAGTNSDLLNKMKDWVALMNR